MAASTSGITSKLNPQFLLDAYTGMGGFAYGYYLSRHTREDDSSYAARKDLAVYPNYCRKIVDVFMGFLWKQSPSREVDDGLYAQFMANADGLGGKLDTVMSSYQRLAMLLGTVFIIVDKPKAQGATAAQQAYPYLTVRLKNQLVDEEKDADGNWAKVVFSEAGSGGKTQYRTFTASGWRVSSEADGSGLIEEGVYGLGRVPVVRLHIAKPLNPSETMSQSFFYDLAQLNWELYNVRSELRELERQQAFSILTFPVVDDTERSRLQDLTIGTKNGLAYNPSGGGKPEFIAPPDGPALHLVSRMAAIVEDIYSVSNLEFVGSAMKASGEALSFHFMEANSALGGMAEMAEYAETEIAQLVYLWQGQNFTGNISYPSDFNLSDVIKSITVAMDTVNLGMGAAFDKALKKRLSKQVLGSDVGASTLAEIDAEIDAQGDLYGNRLQQQAGM